MTVFEKEAEQVQEIKPGIILVVRANGATEIERFADDPARQTGCSFERIYFSRGNDPDIYSERKTLGALLVPQVLKVIGEDFPRVLAMFQTPQRVLTMVLWSNSDWFGGLRCSKD